MRIKALARGDRGVRWDHVEQLLDMLLPAARLMISPETVKLGRCNKEIEPGHYGNPRKHHPLQARNRHLFSKWNHSFAKALPLHLSPLGESKTRDLRSRRCFFLVFPAPATPDQH